MTEPKPQWPNQRISFTVYGNPIPKARPRVTGHGTYTPQRVKDWQNCVAATHRQTCEPVTLTGSIQLTLHFYRKDRRRVDLDNLIKAVMDGLTGVAWADDSQICHIVASVQRDKDNPRVEVAIEYQPRGEKEETP